MVAAANKAATGRVDRFRQSQLVMRLRNIKTPAAAPDQTETLRFSSQNRILAAFWK